MGRRDKIMGKIALNCYEVGTAGRAAGMVKDIFGREI